MPCINSPHVLKMLETEQSFMESCLAHLEETATKQYLLENRSRRNDLKLQGTPKATFV